MVVVDIFFLVTAEKEENGLPVCLFQQGNIRTGGRSFINVAQRRAKFKTQAVLYCFSMSFFHASSRGRMEREK